MTYLLARNVSEPFQLSHKILLVLRIPFLFVLSLHLLSSVGTLAAHDQCKSPRVGPPPAELRLDPFYKKCISFRELPIVSSEKVSDEALREAQRIVQFMVAKHPELVPRLSKHKVRVVVMAESEQTTDVPEHRHLKPKEYWDKRARGLGATRDRPATSCGEENLLQYPTDPYRGENILIHEFAHTLHEMAIVEIDKQFDEKLKAAYANATKQGLWQNTYAATNHKEYWAEGVQSWFNANREVSRNDGIHNGINTHRELREYDPELAGLIAEWFDEPESGERQNGDAK